MRMKTGLALLPLLVAAAALAGGPGVSAQNEKPARDEKSLPPELAEARRVTQGEKDPLAATRAAWAKEIEAGLAEQTKADVKGSEGKSNLSALRARYESELAAKETPVLRYLLGRLLGKLATKEGFDRKLLDAARKEFVRSIEMEPKFHYGHEGLALCAVFNDDVESAITEYREVVKAAPTHWAARLALARLFIAQGAVRDAREQFAAVPEGAPEWAEARIGQGETELRLGMTSAAIAEFEAVRAKDPDHLRAAYGLAQALVTAERGEAAEAVYADIVKRHENEMVAEFFLARLVAQRGDAAGATARLESLISKAEARLARGDDKKETLPLDLARVKEFLEAVKAGKLSGPQPKSLEDVVSILENATDPEQRRRALRTLAKVKSAEVFAPIVRALLDPDHGVRIIAVREVAERGGPEAAKVVRNLLKDENPLVRAAAADALGKVKNPSSVDGLVGALRDSDPDVRDAAIRALSAITGREDPILFESAPSPEMVEKSIEGWVEWWAKNRDLPARE